MRDKVAKIERIMCEMVKEVEMWINIGPDRPFRLHNGIGDVVWLINRFFSFFFDQVEDRTKHRRGALLQLPARCPAVGRPNLHT